MKVYTLNKKFTALSRAACDSRNTAVSEWLLQYPASEQASAYTYLRKATPSGANPENKALFKGEMPSTETLGAEEQSSSGPTSLPPLGIHSSCPLSPHPFQHCASPTEPLCLGSM